MESIKTNIKPAGEMMDTIEAVEVFEKLVDGKVESFENLLITSTGLKFFVDAKKTKKTKKHYNY